MCSCVCMSKKPKTAFLLSCPRNWQRRAFFYYTCFFTFLYAFGNGVISSLSFGCCCCYYHLRLDAFFLSRIMCDIFAFCTIYLLLASCTRLFWHSLNLIMNLSPSHTFAFILLVFSFVYCCFGFFFAFTFFNRF